MRQDRRGGGATGLRVRAGSPAPGGIGFSGAGLSLDVGTFPETTTLGAVTVRAGGGGATTEVVAGALLSRGGRGDGRQGSSALPVAEIANLAVSLREAALATVLARLAVTVTLAVTMTLVTTALGGFDGRQRTRTAPFAGEPLVSAILGCFPKSVKHTWKCGRKLTRLSNTNSNVPARQLGVVQLESRNKSIPSGKLNVAKTLGAILLLVPDQPDVGHVTAGKEIVDLSFGGIEGKVSNMRREGGLVGDGNGSASWEARRVVGYIGESAQRSRTLEYLICIPREYPA